jgi:hypothetical protein
MECDDYRDKWHDIYKEVTSKLMIQARRMLSKSGNNSNTNITDVVNKMMGRSSTSPEFITFREFAIEAKFSKLTCRNISTSQAYSLSGKILLEFICAFKKHV